MIRVHVAAEKSISSAMEDKNVGKNWNYSGYHGGDMRKFYGEEIEMKNILRNRDFFTLKHKGVV